LKDEESVERIDASLGPAPLLCVFSKNTAFAAMANKAQPAAAADVLGLRQ
jgi:hypothetical protein